MAGESNLGLGILLDEVVVNEAESETRFANPASA